MRYVKNIWEIKYICRCCGTVYDDDVAEARGMYCRKCDEHLTEAKQCEICGEWYSPEDLEAGVCESCIDECRENIDRCFEVGAEEKCDVKINSFLYVYFDNHDIEAILLDYLKKTESTEACDTFINSDKYGFAEKLKKIND